MNDDKFRRHETPMDVSAYWLKRDLPINEYQALMEAAPHEEAGVSVMERLKVREALADAIDALTPLEVWVFNALVIEGLSLRKVAQQLSIGKTTVAVYRDSIFNKLRSELESNPDVQSVLKGISS
jgi:DNA-directed RNA polymerase specialized sigma24 family protein